MTEKDKKKKTVSSDASKKTKTVKQPTVKKKVVVRKSEQPLPLLNNQKKPMLFH